MTQEVEQDKIGTTIHVSFESKFALDRLKVIPRESYESVIQRLMDDYHKHHKTKDPPADVASVNEPPKQEA